MNVNPSPFSGQSKHHRAADNRLEAKASLSYQEVYPCPVCRHGQISTLVMMDAFACNFCRHIFTANLAEQSLRLEDSTQAFRWRWAGHHWQPCRQSDQDVTFVIWLISVALVSIPPGLIWLSYHTFPPLPDSKWYWFPIAWAVLSFLEHSLLVLWLLCEHYQFPLYVTLRIQLQRWQQRI
jgi:hypothetical protein